MKTLDMEKVIEDVKSSSLDSGFVRFKRNRSGNRLLHKIVAKKPHEYDQLNEVYVSFTTENGRKVFSTRDLTDLLLLHLMVKHKV